MPDDEGAAAEKRKQELKGKIDFKFIQFDDLPRVFGEGVEGLYAQPIFVLTGGLTSDNEPAAALMDSSRRLEVAASAGAGAGKMRNVDGTYTKGATGTVGRLRITPVGGDILYFMYGIVTIGATKVGAGTVTAGIGDSSAAERLLYMYQTTVAADEVFHLPGVGEVVDELKVGSIATPYQAMIVGSDYHTLSSGRSPNFFVDVTAMAAVEDYLVDLYFWSMNDLAPTTAVGTSDAFA